MQTGMYQVGDWVIVRMTKHSEHPGPRASSITPSRYGEAYTYIVDKFWVVTDVGPGNQLTLRTRRGKVHHLAADDPRIKKANLLQRILYRQRFESVLDAKTNSVPQAG
ncbi:MAG: hypothetical protein R3B90_18535 [Planctomycetaceae bacterium]